MERGGSAVRGDRRGWIDVVGCTTSHDIKRCSLLLILSAK